jgi:hypothetical protein
MQARRASMPLRTKSMLTNFVDMDNLTKKSWDYKSRASSCANDDGPMYMYVCAHGECEYAAHNCVMIHMHIWSRVVRALGAEAALVKQWHLHGAFIWSKRVRACPSLGQNTWYRNRMYITPNIYAHERTQPCGSLRGDIWNYRIIVTLRWIKLIRLRGIVQGQLLCDALLTLVEHRKPQLIR